MAFPPASSSDDEDVDDGIMRDTQRLSLPSHLFQHGDHHRHFLSSSGTVLNRPASAGGSGTGGTLHLRRAGEEEGEGPSLSQRLRLKRLSSGAHNTEDDPSGGSGGSPLAPALHGSAPFERGARAPKRRRTTDDGGFAEDHWNTNTTGSSDDLLEQRDEASGPGNGGALQQKAAAGSLRGVEGRGKISMAGAAAPEERDVKPSNLVTGQDDLTGVAASQSHPLSSPWHASAVLASPAARATSQDDAGVAPSELSRGRLAARSFLLRRTHSADDIFAVAGVTTSAATGSECNAAQTTASSFDSEMLSPHATRVRHSEQLPQVQSSFFDRGHPDLLFLGHGENHESVDDSMLVGHGGVDPFAAMAMHAAAMTMREYETLWGPSASVFSLEFAADSALGCDCLMQSLAVVLHGDADQASSLRAQAGIPERHEKADCLEGYAECVQRLCEMCGVTVVVLLEATEGLFDATLHSLPPVSGLVFSPGTWPPRELGHDERAELSAARTVIALAQGHAAVLGVVAHSLATDGSCAASAYPSSIEIGTPSQEQQQQQQQRQQQHGASLSGSVSSGETEGLLSSAQTSSSRFHPLVQHEGAADSAGWWFAQHLDPQQLPSEVISSLNDSTEIRKYSHMFGRAEVVGKLFWKAGNAGADTVPKLLRNELAVLRALNSDGDRCKQIVEYFGCNDREDCFTLFMEYAPLGSLRQHMTEIRSEGGVSIAFHASSDVAKGLLYVHSRGIVHGDIKPDNVLVFPPSEDPTGTTTGLPPRFKLCDFGTSFASERHGKALTKPLGTAGYSAPELYATGTAQAPSDAWSWGIMVVEMLGAIEPPPMLDWLASRETPFDTASAGDWLARVPTGPIAAMLANTARHAVQWDSEARATFSQIVSQLSSLELSAA